MRKKRDDAIKKVTEREKQRMKPVLTQKARKAKPQYLDHYIKHKLSLESVPELVPGSNFSTARSLKKANTSSKMLEKYTVNEKSV